MRLADSFIEQVDRATDIVRVVGTTVALKPAGQSYKGLCPFHDENTPSFSVSPLRRRFYCFGCSKGGTVFQFLMQTEGLTFVDAVKRLALAANLPFPEMDHHEGPDPDVPIYQAIAYAAKLYHDTLLQDPQAQGAREYLQSRGLTPEDWVTFKLGYAPGVADFLHHPTRPPSISLPHLKAAGLVVPYQDHPDRLRDRFHQRIMFPIANSSGRLCGFGGRVGPKASKEALGAKYLNSPESPYFKKSKLLYLYDRAAATRGREKSLILVEGYLDAIALHKAGWTNTVALMGTALSHAHLDLLQQAGWRPVLCLDADKAGAQATWKSLGTLLGSGLKPRVCTLPGIDDPDQFLAKHGPTAFQTCLTQARPLFDWACDQILAARHQTRADDYYDLLQLLTKAIDALPNELQRHGLQEMLQIRLGTSTCVRTTVTIEPPTILSMPPLERRLCHALTLEWLTPAHLARLQPEWCQTPAVARYVQIRKAQPSYDFPLVLEGADTTIIQPLIRAVQIDPDPAPTDPQALDHLLTALEQEWSRRQIRAALATRSLTTDPSMMHALRTLQPLSARPPF